MEFRRSVAAVVDTTGVIRGTAWLATAQSFVTCAHVVDDCDGGIGHLRLVDTEAEIVPTADGIERREDVDVAIVRIAGPVDAQPLPIAETVRPGESVGSYGFDRDYAARSFPEGHPMGLGTFVDETTKVNRYQREQTVLFCDGPNVNEGLSGGPLWSIDNEAVVGVVTSSNKNDQVWAVPITDLQAEWPAEPVTVKTAGHPNALVTETARLTPVGLPDRKDEAVPGAGVRLYGRSDLMADLAARLDGGDDDEVDLVALHGMGGIGKSAVALEYCHQHHGDYALVWWVEAESPEKIQGSYRLLADEVGIAYQTDADIRPLVNRYLAALPNWLAVFDNAEDDEVVRSLRPEPGNGKLLVTSRHPDRWARPLAVDVLTADESVEWLLSASTAAGHPVDDDALAAATTLADRLDGLALALTMASAYVIETRESLAGYLELFDNDDEGRLVLDDPGSRPPDYNETVWTAWALSIERLTADNPLATELLDYMSFYAPRDIPLRIFTEGMDVDRADFNQAIRDLRQYSLITVEGRYASVHRLVQSVTRSALGAIDAAAAG